MRSAARLAIALSLLGATAAAAPGAASAASEPYVVVYDNGDTDPAATTARIESRLGVKSAFRYGSALKGFAARLSAGQVATVAAMPEVDYVAKDSTFTAAGWQPIASGDTAPAGLRRIGAAALPNVHGSADTAVAVLDTGVDLANPDLNVADGKNCITAGAAANDDNGHGTNVAGIVGARNDGARVTGVAPGTRIFSVKVLNSRSSGTLSQILCGIDWVTANAATLGIGVANMSIAGSGANDNNCGNSNNDPYHRAICRSTAAGVSYVAAAGNNKSNFDKVVPAAYPEVLSVTAMSDADGTPGATGKWSGCKTSEKDDQFAATYSNFASAAHASHAIAAPGTCVVSLGKGGGTSTYTGTSQAAPHVAGTVALCVGSGGVAGPCQGLTPAQTTARLRADAATRPASWGFVGDPYRPVSGKYFGNLVWAGGY